MRKLFDTTFLVHYLTRPSAVEPYLTDHDTPDVTFLASTISIKELAVGLHHVEEDPSFADLMADIGWLEVRPFTERHAFHAGAIEEDCRDRRLPQEQLNAMGGDILIGGVARAENATVVTRNTGDFQRMAGVQVESY